MQTSKEEPIGDDRIRSQKSVKEIRNRSQTPEVKLSAKQKPKAEFHIEGWMQKLKIEARSGRPEAEM